MKISEQILANLPKYLAFATFFGLMITYIHEYCYFNALGTSMALFYDVSDFIRISIMHIFPYIIFFLMPFILFVPDWVNGTDQTTKLHWFWVIVALLVFCFIVYFLVGNGALEVPMLIGFACFIVSKFTNVYFDGTTKSAKELILVGIIIPIIAAAGTGAFNGLKALDKTNLALQVKVSLKSADSDVQLVLIRNLTNAIIFFDNESDEVIYRPKSQILEIRTTRKTSNYAKIRKYMGSL